MGLDTVELVLEVEDHFGVSISDQDAENCVTLANLNALVVRLITASVMPLPAGVCPTARAFYQFRDVLLAESQHAVPRRAVRPSALIESLLPMEPARYFIWPRVQKQLRLKRPRWSFFRPASNSFVPSGTTVRGVVQQLASRSATRYVVDGTVDPAAVWRDVHRIISEQMGIRESDLHPKLTFVDDLGMG